MSSLDVSVVIPVYNEEGSLKILNDRIKTVVNSHEFSHEIIYIDDGSSDSSLSIMKELRDADIEHIKVIPFRKNYGKAAALSAGFKEAEGDIVITMDADLQDEPNEIPHLMQKINEGYDLVSGWKHKRQDPFTKKIPSKIFNYVTAKMTGINIHDANCGLKAYRNDVVKDIDVYGELHRYIPAIAHLKGYKIGEIKVEHHPRQYGKSKYGLWRFFSGFYDLLTILFLGKFTKRPLHFFGSIGLIFFFLGCGIILYFGITDWLLGTGMHVRPLLLFAVGLVIMAVQIFSIGLLGEMIATMRSRRQDYTIKKEQKEE